MEEDPTAHTANQTVTPDAFSLQVDQLARWLLDQAAGQEAWPMDAHDEFLGSIGQAVSEPSESPLLLEVPSDVPRNRLFTRDASMLLACTLEVAPFEHAAAVDGGSGVRADPGLLARGKQLCSLCPAQKDCLTYGLNSPQLEEGLYGGQTKQERRVVWRQNHDKRLDQLKRIYAGAGEALLAHIERSDDRQLEKIRDALIPFAQRFGTAFEKKKGEAELRQQRILDLQPLLASPEIVERATLVLSPLGVDILRHWVKACTDRINLFEYNIENAGEYTIRNAERLTVATLTDLRNDNFNYFRWYRMRGADEPRNAVYFLAALRVDIPKGNIEALKRLALEKLDLVPKDSVKTLLAEYYGLGDDAALSAQSLAAKYGMQVESILGAVQQGRNRLKSLLGTKEKDEF